MQLKRSQVLYVLCTLALLAALTPAAHAQTPIDQGVVMLADGNNNFGLRLYATLRAEEKGNFFFSPYSITEALTLTLNGAKGDTEAQIRKMMALALSPDSLNPSLATLRAKLTGAGNNPESKATDRPDYPRSLNIANTLFGEQTFPFRETFLKDAKTYFGAGLQKVDFIGAPEAARQQINDWIAKQTQDKIKNIVPPGAVGPDTRLALANAIYFRNNWLKSFQPENTADEPFNLLDGKSVSVKMMHQTESMRYMQGDGYQVVDIPYWGFGSMLIIVPDAGKFEGVEKALSRDTLRAIADGLTSKRVELSLPRFKIEFATSLSKILMELGMTDAFDPDKADFSGMAEVNKAKNLYINNVLHKAFIDVDEKGTEAAAATVVMIGVTSMQTDMATVRVDRPFIFAIRDPQTKTILFMGRVLNPAGNN